MNETIFRISTALILVTGISISSYFRSKADRNSGEKLSRNLDGKPLMFLIAIGGLVLWLSPLIYLINPDWMAWSKLGLPELARWFGIVLGIVCLGLLYWMFSSIGSGITPVSATRKNHQLVTHGIYRWIRHPLYTLGTSLFVSVSLMTDSWFILVMAGLAFTILAIRTPKEEANLIAKFGDEYREYMQRTGRFLPKL